MIRLWAALFFLWRCRLVNFFFAEVTDYCFSWADLDDGTA